MESDNDSLSLDLINMLSLDQSLGDIVQNI